MSPRVLNKREALAAACELVRKFGFVPRTIVWKYLTPQTPASQFRYWHSMKGSQELEPYKSGISSNVHLIASPAFRKSMGEGASVSVRSPIYFEHDEYMMDFILSLKRAGFVNGYWTEQELKMDRLLALDVLGGDANGKIPDMVFDLESDRGSVRVAVEIEKTCKSQVRYRQASLGYFRLRKIDLLLFGVIDQRTEALIDREFGRIPLSSEKRTVGYFTLGEFSRAGLAAELRMYGKKPKLLEFFNRVCGSIRADNTSALIKNG